MIATIAKTLTANGSSPVLNAARKPYHLTGAIQFSSADYGAWGSPDNPRGYNGAVRQMNILPGANGYLDWQLPMVPVTQLATTAFIFWCPGGDLKSIIGSVPIDYASGLEMASPGWELIANKLVALGCPIGIACTPAQNQSGDADPTNPIHVLWLQRQIERCLKLFPTGAKRVWYCDSCNGGNFTSAIGMLKHMRDFVGPDDLLLPECYNTPIDQMAQFIEVSGGCFRIMIDAAGDTMGLSTADRITLQKQYPDAVWVVKDADGFSSTSAAKRALGFAPLVGDWQAAALA